MRRAEIVCQLISAHAKSRLERAGRIVDARVNHAAVARARKHPDFGQRLKHEHVVPTRRKRVPDRAAYNSPADDDYICLVDG